MNPPEPRATYSSRATAALEQADDRDLVQRMSTGDDAALARLYDRWSPTVHSLVLHLVRDGEDAEEVLEETFWQAWRQASRYQAVRGEVGTWLLTIARSRSFDRLRARKRLREEPLTPVNMGDASTVDEASAEDPAERLEMLERRNLVAGALQELPAEQRQVLELAYFLGLSQTEIADRTGQPLGTVKTRTRLAAQKLRESLSVLRATVDGGGSRNG
jgi:RNA polymerase sigma-70 factor, ECF subfamily